MLLGSLLGAEGLGSVGKLQVREEVGAQVMGITLSGCLTGRKRERMQDKPGDSF